MEICYITDTLTISSLIVQINCALDAEDAVRAPAHIHSSVLNSSNYVAMQAKADMELRLFVSKVEPNLAKAHTVGGYVHTVYIILACILYFTILH